MLPEDPEEVYVKEINIYETYHAGAVISIKLKDKLKNSWVAAWESTGISNMLLDALKIPEIKLMKKKLFRPSPRHTDESYIFPRSK